jgi:hypothetical protein
MVDVMNQVIAKLNRPVQFIHMPVPKHRADEEYFAPLKELSANEETELYLGLVHDKDGIEGGLARIKAAKTAVRQFGISTECGLAFRSPENIRQILRISADLADRIDAS